MDKIEIGKDTRITLVEKFKSFCSENEIKTKRKVNQSDVIRLLENLQENDIKGGIDFLDSRPTVSGHEINFTSAGNSVSREKMIEYIERNFYQSEGFYRIYQGKKGNWKIMKLN